MSFFIFWAGKNDKMKKRNRNVMDGPNLLVTIHGTTFLLFAINFGHTPPDPLILVLSLFYPKFDPPPPVIYDEQKAHRRSSVFIFNQNGMKLTAAHLQLACLCILKIGHNNFNLFFCNIRTRRCTNPRQVSNELATFHIYQWHLYTEGSLELMHLHAFMNFKCHCKKHTHTHTRGIDLWRINRLWCETIPHDVWDLHLDS